MSCSSDWIVAGVEAGTVEGVVSGVLEGVGKFPVPNLSSNCFIRTLFTVLSKNWGSGLKNGDALELIAKTPTIMEMIGMTTLIMLFGSVGKLEWTNLIFGPPFILKPIELSFLSVRVLES